jgi:hypothetical protein
VGEKTEGRRVATHYTVLSPYAGHPNVEGIPNEDRRWTSPMDIVGGRHFGETR